MFFIGFFSHIIPLLLIGLGSLSMLYYGNHEKIDEKLYLIINSDNSISYELNNNKLPEISINAFHNNNASAVNCTSLYSLLPKHNAPICRIWPPEIQINYSTLFQSPSVLRGPPTL